MSVLRRQAASSVLKSSPSRCLSSTSRLRDSQSGIRGPNKPSSNLPAPNSPTFAHTDASQSLIDHTRPHYNVHSDHGTSAFSMVPKRVVDGSEAEGSLAAAVLSGAPVDLQARTVRIYRPTKTATQSGDWNGHHWRMDWDVLQKGHRWENPLMGWQSSADFMQGTVVNFRTREDAIRFAEKQGYEYFVQEPNERKFVPKAYANNFLHSPKKLKLVRTK